MHTHYIYSNLFKIYVSMLTLINTLLRFFNNIIVNGFHIIFISK